MVYKNVTFGYPEQNGISKKWVDNRFENNPKLLKRFQISIVKSWRKASSDVENAIQTHTGNPTTQQNML